MLLVGMTWQLQLERLALNWGFSKEKRLLNQLEPKTIHTIQLGTVPNTNTSTPTTITATTNLFIMLMAHVSHVLCEPVLCTVGILSKILKMRVAK